MQQKKWKERIGGNPGLIIIGALIFLSVMLTVDHLFNLRHLLIKIRPGHFEWNELVFDLVAIFCIGLISFILVRKSEAERVKIEQVFQIQSDLSFSLGGVTDLKEGLRLCLEAALDLSGMDSGGIYLYDQTTGCLNLAFQKGLSPDFAKVVSRYEAESANVRLVTEGNPVYAQYQKIGLPLSEIERREGLKALAVIPIRHENQIIGCFNIASRSVEEISLFARQSLEMIAAQTGSSIARLRIEAALHESEERFRQLAENIDQVFWLTDWDAKRLIYVNPDYERLYGRSCQSAYDNRMSWQDVIHPEDRARVREAFARSADLGQYVEAEYRVVSDDGTERWVLDRSYPIRDKYGRIYRFASVAEDITKRKKAEEKLRESKERYKALFERSLDCVYIHDLDGNFLDANPASLNLLGFTRDEIKSLNFSSILSEDQIPLALQAIEELKEKGFQEKVSEVRLKHKNGEYVDVEVKASIIYRDGKPYAVQGIARDITERKRSEEALRESEEKYRALIEAAGRAGEGIIIIQDNGVEEAAFVFVNEQFCRMCGYSREELLGRSAWDFIPHEIAVRLRDWYKRRHNGESLPGHYEAAGVHKDGTIVPLELSIVTMPWQGKIATVLYIRDITERKRAEEEAVQQTKNIESLSETAMGFVELPAEKDIYRFIGEQLRELTNDAFYVLVNSFDQKTREIQVRALLADDQHIQAVLKTLGTDPKGMSFVVSEEAWNGLISGKLVRVPGGIYELSFGEIPKAACDALEKLAGTGDIFTMGFTKKGELYGSASIIMREGSQLSNRDVIETFVRQAGVALQRKLAEEALRAEQDRLEAVTQNMGAGMAIISRDYRTVWANKVLKQIFGEVEGKSCYSTYNQNPDICPGCGVREVFEQGKDVSVHEQVGKDKDGNTIWSQIIATPLKDKEGSITAAMEVVVDITERKKAEEALRESEERYRNFFENAPLGIYRTTPGGRILLSNPALVQMLGYSSFEELASRNLEVEGFEPQYSRNKFKESLEKTSEVRGLESAWLRRDGSSIFVRENARAVRNEDGSILYYEGMAEDITERKKAEEALRTSEERYRLLFERNLAGVFRTTLDGQILDCNESLIKLFGYDSREEFLTHQAWDIYLDKSDRETFISHLLNQKVLVNYEIRFKRKDGSILWGLENAGLLQEKETGASIIESTIIDITERKKAEEALRENEEKYRALLETTDTGFCILDSQGIIMDANSEYVRLAGHSTLAEIMGRNIIEWTAEHDLERNAEEVKKCRQQRFVRNLEIEYVDKQGKTTPVEINASMIQTDKGQRILTLCRDITEKKRLQEQLIQTEKLAAVGTLAYGIAHEFNNILAGMMANAELGLISKEHEQIKECFEIIVDNSHRASSITNNLLAFARHKEARKELVDITESLKSVLAITHRELEKNNIEIIEKFKPVPKIYCDPGQFSEVFLNMITNARDAMHPKGGRLTIQVESAGDFIRIIFKDTGCGIPEEIKGRIFEPFVTTKGALGRSEVPGTGLGLFLTYGIINSYKGKIEVESKVKKGTNFSIIIPISENQPPELPLDTRIESSKETEKKLKILLVDDEKAITLGLKKFLESKGHKVSTSLRAKEGLEIFRKGRFDLVLSDITIPDMDGIELIKKVKEKDQQVKIIVITGHLQKEKEEKARQAGADEVLIKPFRNELLYQAISKVVD